MRSAYGQLENRVLKTGCGTEERVLEGDSRWSNIHPSVEARRISVSFSILIDMVLVGDTG